jgi:hypothetical protein
MSLGSPSFTINYKYSLLLYSNLVNYKAVPRDAASGFEAGNFAPSTLSRVALTVSRRTTFAYRHHRTFPANSRYLAMAQGAPFV